MNVNNIENLPSLPQFRGSCFKDIEIAGKKVRIHKPQGRASIAVCARLAAILSDQALKILGHDDEDSPEVNTLGDILETEGKTNDIKSAMLGTWFPMIKQKLEELGSSGDDQFFWFFERLLPGNVEIDGLRLQTWADIDRLNAGFVELMQMLWPALTLTIYPTQGDPDIDTGSPTPDPQSQAKPPTNSHSSAGAGTVRVGQSVQMSTRSG